jgi:hypothetical protein
MANMRLLISAVFLDRSPRFFDKAAVAALAFITGDKKIIKTMECFTLHSTIELRERVDERTVWEETGLGVSTRRDM